MQTPSISLQRRPSIAVASKTRTSFLYRNPPLARNHRMLLDVWRIVWEMNCWVHLRVGSVQDNAWRCKEILAKLFSEKVGKDHDIALRTQRHFVLSDLAIQFCNLVFLLDGDSRIRVANFNIICNSAALLLQAEIEVETLLPTLRKQICTCYMVCTSTIAAVTSKLWHYTWRKLVFSRKAASRSLTKFTIEMKGIEFASIRWSFLGTSDLRYVLWY